MTAFLLLIPFTSNAMKYLINSLGFENLKASSAPKIFLISYVPSCVKGPLSIDSGFPRRIFPFSSKRYFLARTE